jgi:DNA invertase Pin-like site-specific DNA recombinase
MTGNWLHLNESTDGILPVLTLGRNMAEFDVSYKRVSTEYQYVDAQNKEVDALTARATRKVVPLEEVVSGSKMLGEKLEQLRGWVRSGKVGRIYVYAWDRLGRSLLEGLKFVKLCIEHDVEIVSYREPYDVRRPEGRMMFGILMSIAENFLDQLKENTKRGLQRAKETCKTCTHRIGQHKDGEGCTAPSCTCKGFVPRFKGGYHKKWMSAKVAAKAPKILRYAEQGVALKDIAKLVSCDERTVARVVRERDEPRTVRPRVWDR